MRDDAEIHTRGGDGQREIIRVEIATHTHMEACRGGKGSRRMYERSHINDDDDLVDLSICRFVFVCCESQKH